MFSMLPCGGADVIVVVTENILVLEFRPCYVLLTKSCLVYLVFSMKSPNTNTSMPVTPFSIPFHFFIIVSFPV